MTITSEILRLHADGLSSGEIARQLGKSPPYVCVVLNRARKKAGAPPLRRGRPLGSGDSREETPREAKARVRRDLAEGRRCPHCWLLLPCGGHEVLVQRGSRVDRAGT